MKRKKSNPIRPRAAGKTRKAARLLGVVSTGTEIGKSIITASLARTFSLMGYNVGVFKPFASGADRRTSGEQFSSDADLLVRAAANGCDAHEACGQLFTAPLAPLAAAEAEGRKVDIALALRQTRAISKNHDITLVEGCGGWEVPLTSRKTTADYFQSLGAPVVIVAPTGLGTINHSLLTLQAIHQRGLKALGVILNRARPGDPELAEATNPALLRKFSKVPVWGPIPYERNLDRKRLDEVDVIHLHDLNEIAKQIMKRIGALTHGKMLPKAT